MKFIDLQQKIVTNIFTAFDVEKYFSAEPAQAIRIQLFRFAKRGLLIQIKRGIYCFEKTKVDEFVLANRLYQPSYISLESALQFYGMIPDVPQAVTSINLTTYKKLANEFGRFYYSKIKKQLFFGFTKVKSSQSDDYIMIAHPEKSLLDYFYLRRIRKVTDLRLNLANFDFSQYRKFSQNFPHWVKEINIDINS